MANVLISIKPAHTPVVIRESVARQARMALICMPWGSISTPSLAMALLKSCLTRETMHCKLHYFNVDFASLIGSKEYAAFSHHGHIYPEWFFAYSLYGPLGTKEIACDWETIASTAAGRQLVSTLMDRVGSTESDAVARCRHVADVAVPEFIRTCVDADDWSAYDAIGFTSTFAQSLASLLLAKAIKARYPHIPIILGGANVDGEMGAELLRSSSYVDYVVHGEAEESLPNLIRHIVGHSSNVPPGVSHRDPGTQAVFSGENSSVPLAHMDQSPVPDYSDYISALKRHDLYSRKDLMLFYESSRGCWWGAKQHCTFCGLNGSTMTYRRKSPEKVLAEIQHLSKTYSCLTFAATDNILALDYFATLLPALSQADGDLSLFYEVKANLTKGQLAALAAAGVKRLQPGIESLSTRLLGLMNKGITAIQNIQLLKWCAEYRITPSWNLLCGFPGESPEDYSTLAATLRLLFHLRPPEVITPIQFERFSPYHYKSAEYGLELKADPVYGQFFPSSRVNLDRLAYFFTNTGSSKTHESSLYTQDAVQTLADWKAHRLAFDGDLTCSFRRGPGFIVISDRRHNTDKGDSYNQLTLRSYIADIYQYCDQIRTERSIRDYLVQQLGCTSDAAQAKVFQHLASLVSMGLVYIENGRYLSLAIRDSVTRYGS